MKELFYTPEKPESEIDFSKRFSRRQSTQLKIEKVERDLNSILTYIQELREEEGAERRWQAR